MLTLDAYTAVAYDGLTQAGRRFLARPTESPECSRPGFAVYLAVPHQPARPGLRGELLDALDRSARASSLRLQAAVLDALKNASAAHWVRVVDRGRHEGAEYLVTTFGVSGVDRRVAARARLDPAWLTRASRQVLLGLAEAHEHLGRGHGDLRAESIRLTERGDVLLAEPLPVARDACTAADDARALGAILYELITREAYQPRVCWPIERGPQWRRLGRSGEAWRELVIRLLDPATPDAELAPASLLGELPRAPSHRAPRAAAIAASLALLTGGFVGSAWLIEAHPLRPLLVEYVPTEFEPERWRRLCMADERWLNALADAHAGRRLAHWRDHGLADALTALDELAAVRREVDPDGTYGFITQAIAASRSTPGFLARQAPDAARQPQGVRSTWFAEQAMEAVVDAMRDWPVRSRLGEIESAWSFLEGGGPHGYLRAVRQALTPVADDAASESADAVAMLPHEAVDAAIAWSRAADALDDLAQELRQQLRPSNGSPTELSSRFSQMLRDALEPEPGQRPSAYLDAVRERGRVALEGARLLARYQQRVAEDVRTLDALPPQTLQHPLVQQFVAVRHEREAEVDAALARTETAVSGGAFGSELPTVLQALRDELKGALASAALSEVLDQPLDLADPRLARTERLARVREELARAVAAQTIENEPATAAGDRLDRIASQLDALGDLPWTLRHAARIADDLAAFDGQLDATLGEVLLSESRWLTAATAENLPILAAAEHPDTDAFGEALATLRQRLDGSAATDGPTELRRLRDELDALYRQVQPELALRRLADAVEAELGRAATPGELIDELQQVRSRLASLGDGAAPTGADVRRLREVLGRLMAQAVAAQETAGVDASPPAIDRFWRKQRDALLERHSEILTLARALRTLREELGRLLDTFQRYDPQIPAPPGWQHDAVAAQLDGRLDASLAEVLAAASVDSEGRLTIGERAEVAAAAFMRELDAARELAQRLRSLHEALERFDSAAARDHAAAARTIPLLAAIEPWTGRTLAWFDRLLATPQADVAAALRLLEDADAPNAVRLAAWERLGREAAWPGTPAEFAVELAAQQALRAALATAEPERRAILESQLRAEAARRWQRYATSGDADRFEAAVTELGTAGVDEAQLTPAVRFDRELFRLKRALLAMPEEAPRDAGLRAMRAFQDAAPAGVGGSVLGAMRAKVDASAEGADRPRTGPAMVALTGLRFTEVPQDTQDRATFTWRGPSGTVHELPFVRVDDGPGGLEPVMLMETELPIELFLDLIETTRASELMAALLNNPVRSTGPVPWILSEDGVFTLLDAALPHTRWISTTDPLLLTNNPPLRPYANEVPPPDGRTPLNHISPEAATALAALVGCRLPTSAEWREGLHRTLTATLPEAAVATRPPSNLRDATWRTHYRALRQHADALDAAQRRAVDRLLARLLDTSAGFPYPSSTDSDGIWPRADGDFDDRVLWLAPVDVRPEDQHFAHLIGNVAEFVYDGPPVTLTGAEVLRLAPNTALREVRGRLSWEALGVIGGSFQSPPQGASSGAPGAVDAPQPLPSPRVAWTPQPEGWSDVGMRLAYTAPEEALHRQLLAVIEEAGYLSLADR